MRRNVLRIALALVMMLAIVAGTTTTVTKNVDAACSHPTYVWIPYQAATCTKMKIDLKVCTKCGDILGAIIKPVDPNKHTWQRVTVIQQATCTRSGVAFERCAECGKTRETTIPATGHRITTKYQNGHYETYCSICGSPC